MKRQSPMLSSYHQQMITWRAEGLSFDDIAVRLQAQGCSASKGKVYRYFQKAGLPTDETASDRKDSANSILAASVEQTVNIPADHPPNDPPNEAEEVVVAILPQQPIGERFLEIEPHRVAMTALANSGCGAEAIQILLKRAWNLDFSRERLQGYIDGLMLELYPPGPIQPHLFEVKPTEQRWPDEMPVVNFGKDERLDVWTVDDFSRATIIFGAPGCGKTTGSGRVIAGEFLLAGYGGIVLTTKQNESHDWINLATACKRDQDIALIKPGGPLRLNVLQYEASHPGNEGFVENLVSFFKNLASVVGQGRGNRNNADFWQTAGDELIRNVINLLLMGGEGLTFDTMCELVVSAPISLEAAAEDKWPKLPFFGDLMTRAQRAARTPSDLRAYKRLEHYWLRNLPNLAPETRSCITFAFSAMVDVLCDRQMHELLSTYSNITPECIFNGRIVILDLPINEYHEAGLMVQAAWKYVFMRAALRRPDFGRRASCRPVFMWEDECEKHLIDYDPSFQRVAREYRVARVMLTQNIQNLYDRFGGGGDARAKIDSLIGNIGTRMFHANADHATNKFASDSWGTVERTVTETSSTPQHYHGLDPIKSMLYRWFKPPVVGKGERIVREPLVHPHQFLELKTGGKQHDFVTEALVSQVGRIFSEGWPCRKMAFRQIIYANQ